MRIAFFRHPTALTALTLLLAGTATASPIVANGSFEQTTLTTKGSFVNNVPGWSGGSNLTFLNFPGTATTVYLAVYGPFPATSPDGGNFVEMDGDPSYSSAIYQTLSGLSVGTNYAVSFDEAAGQQDGYKGATTEEWQVSLGSQVQYSAQYSLPQGGIGPWQQQTLVFTATSTSEVLSFLAKGTPSGQPPISFLDGVSVTAVPEPASVVTLLGGVMGLITLRLRRRSKSAQA